MTPPPVRHAGSGGGVSSTTLRFAVLVMTSVVAALNIGLLWRSFSPPYHQGDEACRRAVLQLLAERLAARRAAGGTADPQAGARAFLDAYVALGDQMPRCLAVPDSVPARVDLILPALLLCGACALYLVLPTWRIASRRLIRLDRAGQPDACREVHRMITESGVRVRRVWLDPAESRVDGAVFGLPGRRYIMLTRGVLALWQADPDGLRAVVWHELGHLRNRDVDIMHATVALWRCFLWLIAAPTVVLFARYLGSANGDRVTTAFHLVVLLGVLYWLHNGVLRARELYADAAVHDHRDTLIALIERGTGVNPPADRTRILGPHPAPLHRIAALRNPHRLADLGVGDAFATGLVLMLAAPTLLFSVSSLAQRVLLDLQVLSRDEIELVPSFAWTTLLLVVPAGAGVAVGLWRLVHAAPLRTAGGPVARIAAALAAGMLLGDMLAPSGSNLGPQLLLSGDAGWRWQALLVLLTLLTVGLMGLVVALWPAPTRGGAGVAVPLAAYGSLLFCSYLPGLLATRYPQHRSESPRDLVGYAGDQLRQLLGWLPGWLTPGALGLLVVAIPLGALAVTVVRLARTRTG